MATVIVFDQWLYWTINLLGIFDNMIIYCEYVIQLWLIDTNIRSNKILRVFDLVYIE